MERERKSTVDSGDLLRFTKNERAYGPTKGERENQD